MPIEITIPRLGWSMDEGVFAEWLKSPGEFVNKGEMVFVLEGEKAAQEIESFDSGTLHVPPDAPQPGDTVKVGQLIGFLLAEGEVPPSSIGSTIASSTDVGDVPNRDDSASGTRPTTSQRAAGPAARREARRRRMAMESVGRSQTSRKANRARVIASPRARRRARELGVDWSRINGTGRNGRVRERDVISHSTATARGIGSAWVPTAPGKHQPASTIRRTIATRMVESLQQTAPVTLTTKVNATGLVGFRGELAQGSEAPPSYTDIIIKLVARALPDCPELNACWHDNGVYLYDKLDIAFAVDTEAGLLTPVIRSVDRLSLQEVADQSKALADAARSESLNASDLKDATFTVTNLGAFGIDAFTPIINVMQSAVLGIGRIVTEPVVVGEDIVVGRTMSLSLTFDHRVLDGAPAARWLQRLSQLIEQMPGYSRPV